MKNFFKLILPPFLFIIIKKATTFFKNITNSNIATYDNDLIAKVVIEKNIIYRDKLAIKNELDFSSLRSILGISITGMNLKNNELNVLDFGGGGGYHYFISKIILNDNVKINWHVVETSSIVENANKISNNDLRFFKTIKGATIGINRFDLILASSSLQYCENQFLILQELINLNAKYIFITRTPFTNDKPVLNKIQFSKLSSNGPGDLPHGYKDCTISYPIFIQNINQFEHLFLNHYNTKFKIREEKNAFIIENNAFDNYGYFFVSINP
jgi:putative methyltransferase (TIGR04325 family)